MEPERFPLAPMSRSIFLLTLLLFLLPAGLLLLGLRAGGGPALLPAAGVALIYLSVWLWFRPTRFELDGAELRIVWPIRRAVIPLTELAGAELMTGRQFRERYGWGMRVGAGGLWGGFGLLVTRRGTLRFYISRLDGYVLVESRTARPLLITPSRPELFVRRLAEHRR